MFYVVENGGIETKTKLLSCSGRWGELSHGGVTLCAPALCASLLIWLSLHFVVGAGHVSVGGWYHGGYTLCAAALRTVLWLFFVATCCGGCPGHVLVSDSSLSY